MRVVSGEFRGRRIDAPETPSTRPTTDKVRGAVFNALNSIDAIHGAKVADLYAGSGAIGIEALSRGAVHCTFVERSRPALAALRGNVRHLGIEPRTQVLPGDATALAAGLRVDVVFADPPYDFDDWERLLGALHPDVELVVAEAAREIAADGWEATRAKRYGRTWVTFLRRAARDEVADGSTAVQAEAGDLID